MVVTTFVLLCLFVAKIGFSRPPTVVGTVPICGLYR